MVLLHTAVFTLPCRSGSSGRSNYASAHVTRTIIANGFKLVLLQSVRGSIALPIRIPIDHQPLQVMTGNFVLGGPLTRFRR